MTGKLMIAYQIDCINGTTRSGTVAIPGNDPAAACRATVGLIRGTSAGKYPRPACFSGILPHEIDDITVQCIGPA